MGYKPDISDKCKSHYPPGGRRHAGTTVLLGCFTGTGVEAFSFSSASLGDDATLSLRLDNLVLNSALELDARRNALETGSLVVFAALPRVDGTLGGPGDEVRAPTAEVRTAVEGGAAFPTVFPTVDEAVLVRPEVELTVPRTPCLRLT